MKSYKLGFADKNSVKRNFNDPSKASGGNSHRQGIREASYGLDSESDSEGEGGQISTSPACVGDCHLLLYDIDMAVNHFGGFRS